MLKCFWCSHHRFQDKYGKEREHHHWCVKYKKTCNSIYKVCAELSKVDRSILLVDGGAAKENSV
jgi:hypothetical protein